MFVGHIGVGLGLKRVQPQINIAWTVFFALFADMLLGIFVMLGLESVQVPSNYAEVHFMTFLFPFSHGILATIVWGSAIFIVSSKVTKSRQTGLLLGIAFVSHVALDALVHVPIIPLLGNDSPKIGLGLWQNMNLALTLEMLITAVGLGLYLRSSTSSKPFKKFVVIGFLLLLAVAQIQTQLFGTEAPNSAAIVVNWICIPFVICGVIYWLDAPQKLKS